MKRALRFIIIFVSAYVLAQICANTGEVESATSLGILGGFTIGYFVALTSPTT